MNQNNKWKKVTIAGITAVAVTVGALCSSAGQKNVLAATPDKPETLFKEETVYVTAKADGTPVNTVVSDWMKNAGTVAELSDQTILTDIENVKGNETYTKGANHQITWKTKGTDIYYQGKSEKNPAVGVNITYKLNGKDVTAKQIKGKTGKMEMHIAYTNQQKQEDMYVPFTMITGVMLPTNQFQNVSVDHGKIVSDADKVMVVGIGFPGLKENLDLKEAPVTIPISDCVTITADVTDFSMGATFTAASSDGMDQAGFTEVQNYEQLETSLNKLTEGTHLLDGKSVELKAGIQKLAEGVEAYTDGEEALSSGTKQLLGGTQNIQEGTNRLQSGASELQSGIEAAKAGADQLVAGYENGVTEGAQQLEDGTAQLYGTVEQMSGGLQNVPLPTQEQIDELAQMGDVAGAQAVAATVGAMQQVLNQAGALEGATKQLSVGAADLNGGIVQLADGTSDLQSGLSKLQQGGEQINVGLGTLGEGVGQLQDGAQTLNDGATKLQQSNGQLLSGTSALVAGGEHLTTGTSTLAAGAGTLQNGMQKFQQVKTRMDKMMELGKNYKSFAGIDSKMDGSVKFVIETKEIK
ncbi:MAG: hypothetical protein RR869_02775 [Lachnospiraceae bacterium]